MPCQQGRTGSEGWGVTPKGRDGRGTQTSRLSGSTPADIKQFTAVLGSEGTKSSKRSSVILSTATGVGGKVSGRSAASPASVFRHVLLSEGEGECAAFLSGRVYMM